MPKQKFPEGTQIKVTKQLDEPFIGSLPKGTYDVNDRRLKGYGSLLVKRKLAKLVEPESEETDEAASEGFVENGEVLLAPDANEPYDRLSEFDKPAGADPFQSVAKSVKGKG